MPGGYPKAREGWQILSRGASRLHFRVSARREPRIEMSECFNESLEPRRFSVSCTGAWGDELADAGPEAWKRGRAEQVSAWGALFSTSGCELTQDAERFLSPL